MESSRLRHHARGDFDRSRILSPSNFLRSNSEIAPRRRELRFGAEIGLIGLEVGRRDGRVQDGAPGEAE